jgi:hypothetical protein
LVCGAVVGATAEGDAVVGGVVVVVVLVVAVLIVVGDVQSGSGQSKIIGCGPWVSGSRTRRTPAIAASPIDSEAVPAKRTSSTSWEPPSIHGHHSSGDSPSTAVPIYRRATRTPPIIATQNAWVRVAVPAKSGGSLSRNGRT